MAFKLGKSRRYDTSGDIRKPNKPLKFVTSPKDLMSRNPGASTTAANNRLGTSVFQEPMEDGTLAEANMDGTISVDPSVDLNSAFGKKVLKHEAKHIADMESGKAAYGDNWVMWKGKIYMRENGMIDGPAGRLPEGHKDHPWEKEAIEAENK
jgi:hypothetical protein|tara:strand:+ start:571 stop:1026 length:456 start_codon:yes stop_codon:yes gene_type:complete